MKKTGKIAALAEFDAGFLLGRDWLVGIDEAGRGALAGPVCAAAAAVSESFYRNPKALFLLGDLDDSKRLSAPVRERLFSDLQALKKAGYVDFEAAFASVEEIERENILAATQIAMGRACAALDGRMGLNLRPAGAAATLFGESGVDAARAEVLVDGVPAKKFPYFHRAVVKGDANSLAVAAASIVAKVSRDAAMSELSEKYPRYGFDAHKGYGTAAHLQALMLFGPSPIHRRSFLKMLRPDSPRAAQTELF